MRMAGKGRIFALSDGKREHPAQPARNDAFINPA